MGNRSGTSGHARSATAETHPVFGVMWPLLLVLAVALLAGAILAEWALLAWLAAITAAASWLFFAVSGAGRNVGRRVHLDGDAVVVETRRAFPAAAAVFASTLAAFLGFHAATGDDTLVRLAAALGCLLLLAPLPDLVRAAVAGGCVRFDATHIAVRSWATEASVDWADVTSVDADVSIPSRPAVRMLTRPEAPSLSVRCRRFLVPLEPRAPQGQVVMPALAFDEPWLLGGLLASLVDLTPDDRARRISTTVPLLTGQDPRRI